jgi:hypothetical protein
VNAEAAIARVRARWAHAPLDPRDVEERVAVRIVDRDIKPENVILEDHGACRIFVRRRARAEWPPRPGDWRSCYVHSVSDVDAALDRLEGP